MPLNINYDELKIALEQKTIDPNERIDGFSLLRIATQNKNVKAVRLLVHHGAINTYEPDGVSARTFRQKFLTYDVNDLFSSFLRCCQKGDLDGVHIHLEYNPDFILALDHLGMGGMHHAAANLQYNVLGYLQEQGGGMFEKDMLGMTPFFYIQLNAKVHDLRKIITKLHGEEVVEFTNLYFEQIQNITELHSKKHLLSS